MEKNTRAQCLLTRINEKKHSVGMQVVLKEEGE